MKQRLLLLVLAHLGLGNECYNFNCTSTNPDSICSLFSPNEKTYFTSPCQSNTTECKVAPLGKVANSTCEDAPAEMPVLYPGDKCEKYNCTYGTCQKGVCVGKGKGETCSQTEQCGVGLYCNQKVCTPLLKEGDKRCTSDYDCLNNLGCDKLPTATSGTCKRYFSIKDHAEVQNCNQFKNSLCQSQVCNSKNNKYYCGSLVSSNSVPAQCEKVSDCLSTTDEFFGVGYYSECKCGYNANATKYCDLFPGDEDYKEWTDTLKLWYNSSEISKCHTLRRLSSNCMYDWWNLTDASGLLYYQSRVNYWPKLQNTKDCVGKVYLKDYYQALADYNKYRPDPDDDESSTYLLLAPIFCLTFF